MQTSDSTKEIFTALVNFHKEVGKIKKDSNNPFFKSKYASLSGILEAIDEPLSKNGLALVQFPEGENALTTRLCHVSGEWLESTYIMKPLKDTPQDRGSSITYQRRYAVGAILSLNIDDDDDGNAASLPKQTTPQKQEPAQAKVDDRPWLNQGTKSWEDVITAISKGYTLAQVEQKYKLSSETRKILTDLITNK